MKDERIVSFDRVETVASIIGSADVNIAEIEKSFQVSVLFRDGSARISGDAENTVLAETCINTLIALALRGEEINIARVRYVIEMTKSGQAEKILALGGAICVTAKGKPIKAKTHGQQVYLDAAKKNIITLGIGPAGTGKTYLAVALAVAAFKDKQVNRLIITRPAIEAGEKLGFLPGDLQSKVDPYLRPLYDALFDMLGAESFNKYMERGNIEVAPLAYMRGRTLDDSFIILDEAQNTTSEQMKMFLTRLGANSKAIITGDVTQIDLPHSTKSGLVEAAKVLDGIEDIAIVHLNERDVVRHVLVGRIISAYAKYGSNSRRDDFTPKDKNDGQAASDNRTAKSHGNWHAKKNSRPKNSPRSGR